ncbi:hypothetical protein JD844_013818, partial [Phrynosoma platyrhinos]
MGLKDLIMKGTAETEKDPSENKWNMPKRDRVSTSLEDGTKEWTKSSNNDILGAASVRLDQV